MTRNVALTVLVAALLAGSALAPDVEAKLRPAFGQRTAAVGDTVRFHLGPGASLIQPPIHLHLVPLEQASRSLERTDPHSTEVAFIGSRLTERRPYVDFAVPDVPAGEYTMAIWFQGYASDQWLNGAAGFQPLLTVTEALEPGALDAAAAPAAILFVVLLTGGFLLFILHHDRLMRRKRRWRQPTWSPFASKRQDSSW